MAKKDFTEYERDLKDLQKNPLKPKGKEFNIFPPELDIKESENQDPSVLPATPKLSMRKKAQEGKGQRARLKDTFYRIKGNLEDGDLLPKNVLDEWEIAKEGTLGIYYEEDSMFITDGGVTLYDYDYGIDEDDVELLEQEKTSSKKLAVGDEFVTLNGTPAKVVDTTPDLVIWVAVDGDDFGSEFVEDLEKGGPPYGRGLGPRREHEPLQTEIELEEINE